jgi:hypothetical protein
MQHCEYSLFADGVAVRLVLKHVRLLLTALWKNRIITRNPNFFGEKLFSTA